ncbi:ABC transporter permease [Limobrevibacterium gyesilva]|uniref:ABC transporter permease n=1 Tax=Limobrevibacterium gyesilva TaxID=2991712 RepID=A0AA42CFL0_9PROT|nr:ABC transporter permease [Limobrevibacterium gyesilva]MCW3473087.1 ABC transporter permease [Limobrevibacterium gyesilva]
MTVALQPGTRGAKTLELTPGNTAAERQRMAVRDLREAASLWRLCWTLAWLDIRLRYRGSMLGPFWLTLSTGAMVAAMGAIYSTLFRMDLHEYLPFLAVSQVLWGFLATLVTDACTGYTSNEGMIRSIRMPFSLYAARIVLRNLIVLAHNTVVFVVVDAVLDTWPGPEVILAIPGMALWLVDSLAITATLGALCARFRDIPPIVTNVLQMAFFVTPVIWKPELVGDAQWMLPFNPFFTLLEVVRGPLLGTVPDMAVYASAIGSSILLCGVSWLLFSRVRGRIAFWI